jgi:tRNA A-37 threonylcarbamoyl transferase component Bud32
MSLCPFAERLPELLSDGTADTEREQLERHLDECADCQQALLDLSGDATVWDSWTGLLRHQEAPAEPSPDFLELCKTTMGPRRAPRARGEEVVSWPEVPGYEILGELGRGGMGVVYKARQRGLNRLVALKMILTGQHAPSDFRARFRAEAKAVARLEHPHIVQVHDTGEVDGLPYFSLELIDGSNLTRGGRDETRTPIGAAALVETLARAMHYAHRQGVVHCDLKRANILLTKDGRPKITDFGLAVYLDEGAERTRTGEILGTPNYMAPEQAQGRRRDVGPATDIHALGGLLYELLTGRPPFAAATGLETLVQVSFEEPLPPRRLQPAVPRDLETICLNKLPQRRYASAGDLAEDLLRFRLGDPIRARPVTAAERAVKWARRRPVVASLAAGLVAVTLLAFVSVSLALVQARTAKDEEARQRQEAEAARAQTQLALDRSERSVYFGNIAQARSQGLLNNVAAAKQLLDRCPPSGAAGNGVTCTVSIIPNCWNCPTTAAPGSTP